MAQFLAVKKILVVDVPFQAAIAEIPEVLDVDGITVLEPAVPAVPEVTEVTHLTAERAYIEDSEAQVALNLAADADGNGPGIDYYHIKYSGAQVNASLQPVNLKGGPRASAPAREVIEIQAGGIDVGSAIRSM